MLEIQDLAWPVPGVPLRDLRAPVRGTVLHEKKFPGRVGLGDYGFDRFDEEPFGVQDRDDNSNDGLSILRVKGVVRARGHRPPRPSRRAGKFCGLELFSRMNMFL